MPFPCGQTWTGSTRGGHSPSTRSIDWNRTDDDRLGRRGVRAGCGCQGRRDERSGYGHHVVVDHQNGESTLYAHLDAVVVAAGQRVDQGAQLGTVGATGNARGAHLHFEERSGRSVIAAVRSAVLPTSTAPRPRPTASTSRIAGNFAGDAAAEVAVYRRAKKSDVRRQRPRGLRPRGAASVARSTSPSWATGTATAPATWASGSRRTRSSSSRPPPGCRKIVFGIPSDRPVAGDWNGDGTSEVGVYRPSAGAFYLRAADGTHAVALLGDSDDLPVTGDWNGDRVTDVGVFDQSTATFGLRVVDAKGQVWTASVQLGAAWDLPVTGDWDGNGVGDLGVWTPATATFVQSRTRTDGTGRLAADHEPADGRHDHQVRPPPPLNGPADRLRPVRPGRAGAASRHGGRAGRTCARRPPRCPRRRPSPAAGPAA